MCCYYYIDGIAPAICSKKLKTGVCHVSDTLSTTSYAVELGLSCIQYNCSSMERLDVFTMSPITALKLLCAGVEALVKLSEDTLPLKPADIINTTRNRVINGDREKISRKASNSVKNLTIAPKRPRTPSGSDEESTDVVITSRPIIIIGDNAEPQNVQHSAITRKFYSKYLPPISLVDYLMRIHKFCPMSTAVYLSTSCYIQRLAVDDKAIPVTDRNCHRLVLAGLRVAMKALEDHGYAHSRFAKVGGVSEDELARLEISFCFLTNFDLKTSEEALLEHAISLKTISSIQGALNPGK